jgi:small-conductance mechanosensitive channel
METIFWENTVAHYVGALTVVVIALLVIVVLRRILRPRHAEGEPSRARVDELLRVTVARTRLSLLLLVVLYFASRPLILPELAWAIIRGGAVIAFLVQLGLWVSAGLDYWVERYRHGKLETDAAAVTTISAVGFVIRIVLWALLFLVGLQNFGFEVTPLIAGLGIGGIAIALALQAILGDLFASLSIVIDKPFVIGDFIIVGDYLGTVEHIGLKTTRIRSLSGEQVIMSNGDLLQSRIRNYKRMFERRAVYNFAIAYGTSPDLLEKIPRLVKEAVEQTPNTRFDRSHFKGFGDYAYQFETVFWITQPDFNIYMDAQQQISLKLVRAFEGEGIRPAVPVRQIVQEKGLEPGGWGAGSGSAEHP